MPTENKTVWLLTTLAGSLLIILGIVYWQLEQPLTFISPYTSGPSPTPTPPPLLEYTFENLTTKPAQPSQITILSTIQEIDSHTEYLFSYQTLGKTMTGQLNIPTTATPSAGFPTILMLRGFVDRQIYQTGIGTRNAAAVFATNGFATIAPDQLGYGGSDQEDLDSFAARVKRPYNMLNLLASIQTVTQLDKDSVGIWGHSNGGQIAISLLEISQEEYPTTLWAPVTKSFPYSILYYTDEYPDQGKALRQSLANFESVYDTDLFSIHKYLDRINAPIQLHQGGSDEAVPLEWSREFASQLESLDIDIELYVYPSADHNLRPDWDQVIRRDVAFFAKHL